MNKIRVGFIGLNPDSHWASTAHIPALKSLSDDFEVVGVANSTLESAKRTAEALNLKHAFANPRELVASEEIDLVVVTVKVPYHYELVSAALEAGKHVHCEWPLGNGLDEAHKLTALAAEKGVVNTVGTQMRAAVEVKYLRQLVADGYVGDVLSTTLVGDAGGWGPETVADLAYLNDKSTGATMLTIPFGHTLAGVRDVLGEFADISGRMILRRDQVRVTDTGETLTATSEDQIMVNGVLESGAAFSAHYRGGMSRGTNFLWEINGTEGDIQVTAGFGHGQMAQLSISGARGEETGMQPLTPPAEMYDGLPDEVIPRNVRGIYALIAKDIRNNTREAPSFGDALRLHELLDAIEQSSQQCAGK
ncbi:gfo/Idh/MocA family oxidoreductase [Pseudodesulfovibrio cashew]|uniref:Gfo/Idh/MocA family oxidoreductase n=1 Tax=Pseudodesulfovibrio cashew TaxID=2678688 RepID=A0A6I6JBW0_9BACT|nr:Gfo/Idh/MocA family oxidoreductase [Pseudodesulfovibrio cashew]QGY40265.1 gfo/Idh/MocA family oxidoreductase [Pseudodesulfovibrio cashew]